MPGKLGDPGRRLAVALLALSALACAAPPAGPPPGGGDTRIEPGGASRGILLSNEMASSSVTFPHSADRTWAALRSAFEALEIPFSENARETTLGHPGFSSRRIAGNRMSRYFDCGSNVTGPVADRYRVTIAIQSAVLGESPDTSELVTTLDAVATARDTRSGNLHCTSTGALERLIRERVEAILGL